MKRFSALLLPVALLGCVKIPETGKSVLLLTSAGQENQLGTQGYKEVLAKEAANINRDPRLNQILQRVGHRIAAQARRPDFAWEFTLIDSKEQNAWCMPGGKVAVYTGILPVMQNEAGMAVVLGHEAAHATLRHAGQRISQTMLVEMGLSAADLGFSNAKYRRELLGLLGAGAAVGILLPYSREHESEADTVGLKYAAEAGYDPREAVTFWQRFAKSAGGAPPEFLSTHPGARTRIQDLGAQMPEALRIYESSGQPLGLGEKLL